MDLMLFASPSPKPEVHLGPLVDYLHPVAFHVAVE